MHRSSIAALVLVGTICARDAHAQAARISSEQITNDLDDYYAGEARSAYGVMGLSVLATGGGAILVTRHSDFARGLGWPLLVLGAFEGIGALFYSFQVGAETRHYRESFAANPRGFRDEEIRHMEGTTRRFVFYQATELALTLTGASLASYGFSADKDAFEGAGLGLFAIGFPFLLIDAVNQERAARYLDHVQQFDPPASRADVVDSHASDARVFGGATPYFISYGGSF